MQTLQLIVNGDDFGFSESINNGIVRAHTDGILTSASLVAAGGAFDHAVRLARARPTLDLGVHLTLTGERAAAPPLSVPSLLCDGRSLWPNPAEFLQRFVRGAISIDEVELELRAQLTRVLDTKLPISHLDGHQHLHALPGIRGVVAGLARHYAIDFVRRPCERLRAFMLHDPHRLGRAAANVALSLLCGFPLFSRTRSTNHFVGFYFGGRLNRANLTTLIDALPRSGTCELMCHPGADADDTGHFAADYDRRAECDALCDPDVRHELQKRGIQLVSFADISAG
jgi:chitin disaccharide deacetylase